MHLNPIPTLFSESQKNLPASLLPKVDDNPTRFPIPKKNLPEKKETLSKLKEDKINSFEDLNSSLLEKLGEGFIFKRFEDHALLFILQYSIVCPKVTSCIRIDMNLRIQLFYKDSPVPLPKWFYKERVSKLTSFSMLTRLMNHIKSVSENQSNILEEWKKIEFTKSKPVYSANRSNRYYYVNWHFKKNTYWRRKFVLFISLRKQRLHPLAFSGRGQRYSWSSTWWLLSPHCWGYW